MPRVNWLGFVAAAAIAWIAFSTEPWWIFKVGENLVSVELSPFYYNIGVLGSTLHVPVIDYLVLAARLLALAAVPAMIAASLTANRKASKHVMGFAWKKIPFYVISLIIIIMLLPVFASIGVVQSPIEFSFEMSFLTGTGELTANIQGISLRAPVLSELTFEFWKAVAVSIICIASRVYHGHLLKGVESS